MNNQIIQTLFNSISTIILPKLVSLNPDRYDLKKLNVLMDSYREYVKTCTEQKTIPKYFETWLKTEI